MFKAKKRNLKCVPIGKEPQAIRTIKIFTTYKIVPLKGYKLGRNKETGKDGKSYEVVNLQNAEVTKMLDTKNSAK